MRRRYEKLTKPEQAIVRVALPRDTVTRDDVVDALAEDFDADQVREAFSTLCDSNRLVREGNSAEYMMVERDLF